MTTNSFIIFLSRLWHNKLWVVNHPLHELIIFSLPIILCQVTTIAGSCEKFCGSKIFPLCSSGQQFLPVASILWASIVIATVPFMVSPCWLAWACKFSPLCDIDMLSSFNNFDHFLHHLMHLLMTIEEEANSLLQLFHLLIHNLFLIPIAMYLIFCWLLQGNQGFQNFINIILWKSPNLHVRLENSL